MLLGGDVARLDQVGAALAWVLGKGGQRGGRQTHPAVVFHLQSRQDSETLRVAFEANEVLPLARFEQRLEVRRAEVLRDRVLCRVAEGWIANVVCQACGGNDVPDVSGRNALELRAMALDDLATHHGPERPPDRGDLERMGEA